MQAVFHLSMEQSEGERDAATAPYLIAKEGGLYPLVKLLHTKSSLRHSAISTIAIMSQHAPVRLAIFQANALEPLLNVGMAVVSSDEPNGNREESVISSIEAVHVAYTLANLAHTTDSSNR